MELRHAERAVLDAFRTRPDMGPDVDPDSVRIAKSRRFDQCMLHCIEFTTRTGRRGTSIVRALPDEGGGVMVAVVGGGIGHDPHRDHPWVNLAAQWSAAEFLGGGHVVGDGASRAHHVRLVFADGTATEDTVDGGVVLFDIAGPGALPLVVHVLDARGGALSSYTELEG